MDLNGRHTENLSSQCACRAQARHTASERRRARNPSTFFVGTHLKRRGRDPMVPRMRLTVVGSSDAFNSVGRGHSCYLVDAEAGAVMIDFGATALAGLRKIGRQTSELVGLVFTHLHGDHIGGFPFLLIDAMFKSERTSQLPIVGPVGTRDRLDRLMRIAYGSLADDPLPFDLQIQELAPGGRTTLAGITIEGFAADHMDPPEQPLCLRLSSGGRSVAFSGDTQMCEGLRQAARRADLLIAECTCVEPPCGRHCTWQDWREALPTIGCERVVLSHLGSAVRERIEQLQREAPDGVALSFADDGMQVTV